MPVQNAFVATLFIYSILFIWCDTAEARRFTYLKEAKPYTPGELEIENWVTWKTSETVDRFDFRHELEYNFTRHMQLGFYLVDWRHTSIRDDGSQTEYLHSGVEFVWNFTDPVKDILGCSSYSEVLVGHERLVLEQKLLLQKNFGPLVATYNLVLEAKWEEEFEETKGEIKNILGVSADAHELISLGFEFLYEIGIPEWESFGPGLLYVGPNFRFHTKHWGFAIAPLAQLTNRRNEARWMTRLIFAIEF